MMRWTWLVLPLALVAASGSSCRDPKQDWHDRNPRKAAVVPANSDQARPLPAAATQPGGTVIRSSVLMVADETVQVDEIVDDLAGSLNTLSPRAGRDAVLRSVLPLIRSAIARRVAEILVYQEAIRALDLSGDKEKKLNEAVENVLTERIAEVTGGNRVQFEKQVLASGRTMDQLRKNIRRGILVQQYLREKLEKNIVITRSQIDTYYQQHKAKYSSPAKAELSVIRISYSRFLGTAARDRADGGTVAEKQEARAAALRLVNIALGELNARPAANSQPASGPGTGLDGLDPFQVAPAAASFETVARSYSDDRAARIGGRYGPVGATDLLDPELTALVFDLGADPPRVRLPPDSLVGPLESPSAYYLIRTGAVTQGQLKSFRAAQPEIERILRDEAVRRLQDDYLERLYASSGLDPRLVDNFAQTVANKIMSLMR